MYFITLIYVLVELKRFVMLIVLSVIIVFRGNSEWVSCKNCNRKI